MQATTFSIRLKNLHTSLALSLSFAFHATLGSQNLHHQLRMRPRSKFGKNLTAFDRFDSVLLPWLSVGSSPLGSVVQ
eukprot:4510127-Amphidinium_carterae.2